MFVKSALSNESVTLHVIDDPSETETLCDVSVAKEETVKLAEDV